MLPYSAMAGGESMERIIADMGPLLELKRDIGAFYRTLADKRQQVRAEHGGQDRRSQLRGNQNNVTLTWPAVYNPSVEELRTHLKAHVVLMQRLIGDDPDLVSAYQLCDKHLKTIMEAYEAEKANQEQQVRHANNDLAATVQQSSVSRGGQNVDLNGMKMPTEPKASVRARSPSSEVMGPPAKKSKQQTPLVVVGTETLQERMHSQAFHGMSGPWRA